MGLLSCLCLALVVATSALNNSQQQFPVRWVTATSESSPRQLSSDFSAWCAVLKKPYANDEETEYRREVTAVPLRTTHSLSSLEYRAVTVRSCCVVHQVFRQNIVRIEAHNRGGHGWKMGVNAFTDLTADEFRSHMLSSSVPPSRASPDHTTIFRATGDIASNATVDWRKRGYNGPVKQQERCGSC